MMLSFHAVPQNTVYNNLGQECVGAGCSVDLFIFNNSYVDIATIGQICRLTGGEIYKYTYFQVSMCARACVYTYIHVYLYLQDKNIQNVIFSISTGRYRWRKINFRCY